MSEYQQAVSKALEQGYLVTGKGGSWLGYEVAWRRRCRAKGQPAVVVSRRAKLADVYMFLRNVPHADLADQEVLEMLRSNDNADLNKKQIHIIRGERGHPNLLIGLSVTDLSFERALSLAPTLLKTAHRLVAIKKRKQVSNMA